MKENPLFFLFFFGTFGNQESIPDQTVRQTLLNLLLPLFLRPCTLTYSIFCLTEYKNGAWISNLGEFSSDWEEKEDEDGESVQSRTS